jgi:hypothetical protein
VIRLTEIYHWMFEDERWRYKILFQGLLLLVPIVGVIAMLGWTMATCGNLLSGGQDLARTGLYLRRGASLLVVGIVYWIGLGIPLTVLQDADAAFGHGHHTAIGVVSQLYNDIALVLFALLIVPVLVAIEQRGLLGGINVFQVAASIAARPFRTLVALVLVVVALVIGGLGFAVIVAAPFTIAYAAAVIASIAAWWSGPSRDELEAESEPDMGLADFEMPIPFRPPP